MGSLNSLVSPYLNMCSFPHCSTLRDDPMLYPQSTILPSNLPRFPFYHHFHHFYYPTFYLPGSRGSAVAGLCVKSEITFGGIAASLSLNKKAAMGSNRKVQYAFTGVLSGEEESQPSPVTSAGRKNPI